MGRQLHITLPLRIQPSRSQPLRSHAKMVMLILLTVIVRVVLVLQRSAQDAPTIEGRRKKNPQDPVVKDLKKGSLELHYCETGAKTAVRLAGRNNPKRKPRPMGSAPVATRASPAAEQRGAARPGGRQGNQRSWRPDRLGLSTSALGARIARAAVSNQSVQLKFP
jgi:hypothetical protein